jgi:hypothetical protein
MPSARIARKCASAKYGSSTVSPSGGAESPLPSVSGAITWRCAASARISGSSVFADPGDACSITSVGIPAVRFPASR